MKEGYIEHVGTCTFFKFALPHSLNNGFVFAYLHCVAAFHHLIKLTWDFILFSNWLQHKYNKMCHKFLWQLLWWERNVGKSSWNPFELFLRTVVVHIDGVRLCLWTVATDGPTVHPPGDIWAWRVMVEWYQWLKPKNLERSLSQYHFVHHNSHMDWPGLEPGLPWWEAGD
jgi:hypothetical protein